MLYFFIHLCKLGLKCHFSAAALIAEKYCRMARFSVHRSIYMPPKAGPKHSQPSLRPSQSGVSQPGLSPPPLRFSQLATAIQSGPTSQALGPTSQIWELAMETLTNGQSEIQSIRQKLLHFMRLCPLSGPPLPCFPPRKQRKNSLQTKFEQGKGTADQLMPLSNWFLIAIIQNKICFQINL